MSQNFALNTVNPNDVSSIATLLSTADSIEVSSFETLGQYEITDVKFESELGSLAYPRQWMLSFNTTILGYNDENGVATFFTEMPKNRVGDSYVVLPIPSDLFALMIQGGLYQYPEAYIHYLIESLEQQSFYRKTRMSVSTVTREMKDLDVDAGEAGEKIQAESTFLIATELQSFFDFKTQQLTGSNPLSSTDLLSVIQESAISLQSESMQQLIAAESRRINEQNNSLMNTPQTYDLTQTDTFTSNFDSDFGSKSQTVEKEPAQIVVSEEMDLGLNEVENGGQSDSSEMNESGQLFDSTVVIDGQSDVNVANHNLDSNQNHSEQLNESNVEEMKESGVEVESGSLAEPTYEHPVDQSVSHTSVEVVPSEQQETIEPSTSASDSTNDLSVEFMLAQIEQNSPKNKRKNRKNKQRRVYQDSFAQAQKEQEQQKQVHVDKDKTKGSKNHEFGR